MKKIFLLLLFISTIAQSQIINIPDANFKAKLLSATTSLLGVPVATDVNNNPIIIDVNGDNEIQYNEALLVYRLTVRNANISDLTGVEAFTNLTYLNFDFSPITSFNIDISALTNLQTISAYNCPLLTSVNTGFLPSLQNLQLFSNALNSLDLSQFPNLENLSVNNNQFTNLDLSNVPNLQSLSVSNNQLAILDLSNVPSLQSLSCEENLLVSLDLSLVPNLTSLSYGNTGMLSVNVNDLLSLTGLYFYGGLQTSIDVSNLIDLQSVTLKNTNIIALDLSNNPNVFGELIFEDNPSLQYINIKNGLENDHLYFFGNHSSLTFVCADNGQVNSIQSALPATVLCNSYCSFTPGGDYNTITGLVQYDFDQNGCDASDFPANYTRIDVNLDGVSTNSSLFSNGNGEYNLYTSTTGVFGLVPNIENPSFFNVNPISADVPVMIIDNSVTTQNFCITANGVHPDLEIVIAPITPARPGFAAEYKIVYRNKGNQTMSQFDGINFSYNQNLLSYVSSNQTPSSIVSGGMSWDFANLLPFESRSINVVMQINAPTDTNPVNIGDVLQFTSSIMPMAGDESTVDNSFQFNQMVVGSFDPNDITCMEGDVVDPSYIGEYLHYVINFENSGTASAENIVVRIEVNPNDFDINTLRILESSHNATIKITNNILEIIFQTIMLDTGGHGNVLLKIKSKENLVLNDIVTNNAKIYFDYNFPIETNDANTIFQALNNTIPVKDLSISLYPNPTSSLVTVRADNNIKSVELYDVQGRIIQVDKVDSNEVSIDVSKYNSGVYFVKVTTEFGSQISKIIKE